MPPMKQAERKVIALGSRTRHAQAKRARSQHGKRMSDRRLTVREIGGGPEIRTPKSVTRSWISSSSGVPSPHVVIVPHGVFPCVYMNVTTARSNHGDR